MTGSTGEAVPQQGGNPVAGMGTLLLASSEDQTLAPRDTFQAASVALQQLASQAGQEAAPAGLFRLSCASHPSPLQRHRQI